MLEQGQMFPEFELPDQDGQIRTSTELRGQRVVIYFYPKDDTSGCTQEACELRDRMQGFGSVAVLGVSPDDVKSHKKFEKNNHLNFPLLADTNKDLCNATGVWVEKSMYGKKYMGVERTTFLLDKDGTILKVWNKVKPAGHAEEIQKAIELL